MQRITITIETDYPNADGIAYVAANELYKRFTRKPRFNTKVRAEVGKPPVTVNRVRGRALVEESIGRAPRVLTEQTQGSRLEALRSRGGA